MSTSTIEDKYKTLHLLVKLARHVFLQAINGQGQQQHILYSELIVIFLGYFAFVWNMEDVMSSLDCLKSFLSSSSLSTYECNKNFMTFICFVDNVMGGFASWYISIACSVCSFVTTLTTS